MDRSASALLIAAVLLAAGCNDAGGPPRSGGQTAGPDPAAMRAAAWSATSPPPATSCKVDSDCGVFPTAPGDDPCCDVTVTAAPLSVHYMKANADWRQKSCAGVSCPPSELPGAQPASCAFTPRCADGTCGNTCDQPPP